MARKYDLITELYSRTCQAVTESSQHWEAFLRCACRNYRLRFDEQLLVYAQKPDAAAVLEIERWNDKFGRWVNRGAKGIAVFEDADRSRQRLVHYFDLSDTHESRYSRPVPIWQMKPEYTAAVIETLENRFGALENTENLVNALLSAAQNVAEDNLPDYIRELEPVCGSALGLHTEKAENLYRELVTHSVAYMLMARLDIDLSAVYPPDFFENVARFHSPEMLNLLGFAVSDIAEMALGEIARTVRALERQNRTFAKEKESR